MTGIKDISKHKSPASMKFLAILPIIQFLSTICNAVPPPLPAESIAAGDYVSIDDFSYSSGTARTVWKPMAGNKPVSTVNIATGKALRLPCKFRGTQISRAGWDRHGKSDMSLCRGIQFLLYCRNASGISAFNMYFHSGNGWYSGKFDAPVSDGWNTIKIYKNATTIEGQPGGWADVDTIRICAWRGLDIDTEFYISSLGLFGMDGKIVVLRAESIAANNAGKSNTIAKYNDVLIRLLDRAALPYLPLSDLDLTAQNLKGRSLLILPYNPDMSEKVANTIAKFLKTGGKLIICFTLPKQLEQLVGIQSGRFVRQKYPGYFSSIRPSEKPLKGIPHLTRQASWNIYHAKTIPGRSRVGAWWYNDRGTPTGNPAIIVSDNCVFLTHVMLSDDQRNKLPLLLAMIGNLRADLWQEAAQGCIDKIGRFGHYENYKTAARDIRRLTGTSPAAQKALQNAQQLRSQSLRQLEYRNFSEAIARAQKARQKLIEAYCLTRKPQKGERRIFWCHSAFGVAGMNWDQTIKKLADNGFTDIIANMLHAGVAYYKSDLLPIAPEVTQKGDQITLCLTACKKYGISCHIWKVNHKMGSLAPKEFIKKMKRLDRTQVNYNGTANKRWLCPSHPDNQKLEIESMLEVARKYNVDGLHFDYIRYPGKDACFCKGCRKRFETAIGRTVQNWPGDIRNDSKLEQKWLDFRRRQISAVVSGVAQRARKIRPGIQISAAVFTNWPSNRDTIGQDWKLWCDSGWLDFLCPMNYTPYNRQFQRLVEQQLIWAGGIPCYPGIGLSTWSNPTDIIKLIEQIEISRRLRTGGFTIFNYNQDAAHEVLPLLGKGTTRKL